MEQHALFGGERTTYGEKAKKSAKPAAARSSFPVLSLASGAQGRNYLAGESVFWLRILQNQATRQSPKNVKAHKEAFMSELKMKQGLWPAHISVRHALWQFYGKGK